MAKRTRPKPPAAMVLYVEIVPVREDVGVWEMRLEALDLLKQLTCARSITHGHVSDRRWSGDDGWASFGMAQCAAHHTTEEAAERLEVTPATVRRLVKRGELDAVRKGDRTLRIPGKAILRYDTKRSDERWAREKRADRG